MSNQPTETPPQPVSSFDPQFFWAVHKRKIIAAALVLILVLLGAAIYFVFKTIDVQNAEAAYAAADSVEGWQKVIRDFPNSIAAGNSYLKLGEKLRQDGKLSESSAAYEAFVHGFTQHPLLAAGYMGLAANAEVENQPDKALEAYKNFVQQFANSYLAPMALFQQARLTQAKGDLKQAQELFASLTQRYPESSFSAEAGRRAGQLSDRIAQANPANIPGASPSTAKSPQP
jgi:TolA-binding protein